MNKEDMIAEWLQEELEVIRGVIEFHNDLGDLQEVMTLLASMKRTLKYMRGGYKDALQLAEVE
jgi:hypothetical protein